MKSKYAKVNYLHDHPEIIQLLKHLRTNYDYPVKNLKDYENSWVIIETFVPNITTKYGPKFLLIVQELSNPQNPESEPTGKRFKIYSTSTSINNFLLVLRETGKELTTLPMAFKVVGVPSKNKSGKTFNKYVFQSFF